MESYAVHCGPYRLCVVIWDKYQYLLEPKKQLKDENIYRSVTFNEKLIED